MSEKELAGLVAAVKKKYAHLQQFVAGVCQKKLPGVAVYGERGLAKSYTILSELEKYEDDLQIVKLSGHMTPLALYNKMYEFRSEDCILWFDDCDSAFTDRDSLNLLKAAMDTLPKRIVSWSSSSSLVEVPEFEFKGRVIVSTNIKLGGSPHLAAFLDRVHWFGISLTLEEKFVKISEIAKDFPNVDKKVIEEVLAWIRENLVRIGKLLSIRTFVKTLGLAEFSSDWRDLAESMIAQDEILAKEVEQIETKVKAGKIGTGGKKGPKGQGGQRKPYKDGSAMHILFERLKGGKAIDKKELIALIKKQVSQPEGRLDMLARHGEESGQWSIEFKGNMVQMKPGV